MVSGPQEAAVILATTLGLRARQSLFVKCLGRLIQYATEQGYELTLGEGFIRTPRKVRRGAEVWVCDDLEHMANSLHYCGLAIDLNLFSCGEWIRNGGDPAWRDLGGFWLSLDPLCRWGGNFEAVDSNHFSVEWQGRA